MPAIYTVDEPEALAKEMAATLANWPSDRLIFECFLLSVFSAAQKGTPAERIAVMEQFHAFIADPDDPDIMATRADARGARAGPLTSHR